MKVTLIQGQIETLGESTISNHGVKRYSYISFRTKEGEEVIARKVIVWSDVDRILRPGATGAFVVSKIMTQSNEMHAARIGEHSATSSFLQSNKAMVKVYFYLVVFAGICVVLSFFLIGIPFLLLVIWAMIRMPFWRSNILEAAERGGIEVKPVVDL